MDCTLTPVLCEFEERSRGEEDAIRSKELKSPLPRRNRRAVNILSGKRRLPSPLDAEFRFDL